LTDGRVVCGYRPNLTFSLSWEVIMPFSAESDPDERAFRLLGELDIAYAGEFLARLEQQGHAGG
jgi:hypothetical protein